MNRAVLPVTSAGRSVHDDTGDPTNLPNIRRPRYAEVVARLALFFALGGTAYATTIGTSDIRNGAVTTPKLADEAVSHAKLLPELGHRSRRGRRVADARRPAWDQ